MESTFGAEYLETIEAVHYGAGGGSISKADCVAMNGLWVAGHCILYGQGY